MFEWFWVSNTKYRLSYSSPSFNQITVNNEQGSYREGDPWTPQGAASLVESTLFSPVPYDSGKNVLKLNDRSLGSVTLQCITVEAKTSLLSTPDTECLSASLPVLRIHMRANGSLQTLFNEVTFFEGVYIARDIELRSGSKTLLRTHIDVLEQYTPSNDLLVPGSGAVHVPQRVIEPANVIAGRIVKKGSTYISLSGQ